MPRNLSGPCVSGVQGVQIKDLDFPSAGVDEHRQLFLQAHAALKLVLGKEPGMDALGAGGAGLADDDLEASGGHGWRCGGGPLPPMDKQYTTRRAHARAVALLYTAPSPTAKLTGTRSVGLL